MPFRSGTPRGCCSPPSRSLWPPRTAPRVTRRLWAPSCQKLGMETDLTVVGAKRSGSSGYW